MCYTHKELASLFPDIDVMHFLGVLPRWKYLTRMNAPYIISVFITFREEKVPIKDMGR